MIEDLLIIVFFIKMKYTQRTVERKCTMSKT